MTSPDTTFAQVAQDSLALGGAIQQTATGVLPLEGPINRNTLAETTIIYYGAWAQTFALSGEVEDGYDPRVVDTMRNLQYSVPEISHTAAPDVRRILLVSSLSDAVSTALKSSTRVEINPRAEQTLAAVIALANTAAQLLNRIEDYGLTVDNEEVYRCIAEISAALRAQEESIEVAVAVADNYIEDPIGEVESDLEGGQVDTPSSVLDDDPSAELATTTNLGVIQALEALDEPVVLKDTNWSATELEHLRAVISSPLAVVEIRRGDAVIYNDLYPGKAYQANPQLTVAIMDKLGFTFEIMEGSLTKGSSRLRALRKDYQMKSWIDDADSEYPKHDLDPSTEAILRTRAKLVMIHALNPRQRPTRGKMITEYTRKRPMDTIIADINKRVRELTPRDASPRAQR